MFRRFLASNTSIRSSALTGRTAPVPWSGTVAFPIRHWPFRSTNVMRPRPRHPARLMVAVYTDMVGYSRLFALDDTGTVARLRDLHRRLFSPAIRQHYGRLVQTGGDSMLITFDSVSEAVKCAVTIQYALAIENSHWSPEYRMRLRVGVDLGDVIADKTGFHGDGVIVATRLQAVCPPGGVCVSRAVHERGGGRLGLSAEAIGLLTLKNVLQPVEAFILWPAYSHPVVVNAPT